MEKSTAAVMKGRMGREANEESSQGETKYHGRKQYDTYVGLEERKKETYNIPLFIILKSHLEPRAKPVAIYNKPTPGVQKQDWAKKNC